jgi:hypothetical protein
MTDICLFHKLQYTQNTAKHNYFIILVAFKWTSLIALYSLYWYPVINFTDLWSMVLSTNQLFLWHFITYVDFPHGLCVNECNAYDFAFVTSCLLCFFRPHRESIHPQSTDHVTSFNNQVILRTCRTTLYKVASNWDVTCDAFQWQNPPN